MGTKIKAVCAGTMIVSSEGIDTLARAIMNELTFGQ
jgi:hypothetical protein